MGSDRQPVTLRRLPVSRGLTPWRHSTSAMVAATSPMTSAATMSWVWCTWAATRAAPIRMLRTTIAEATPRRYCQTTTEMAVANAVWSEGNPLSAGWGNNGLTAGFATKGRGSEWIAPATLTITATRTIATTASIARPTLSRREAISQTTAAAAGTT